MRKNSSTSDMLLEGHPNVPNKNFKPKQCQKRVTCLTKMGSTQECKVGPR